MTSWTGRGPRVSHQGSANQTWRQHTHSSEWPMAIWIPTKRQRNTSNNTHLWESEAASPGWENVRCLSSPRYLRLLLGLHDKWPTKSNLEKKDSSVLQFTVYHSAMPRPEIKAGAWRRNHEGTLLSRLFTEACAAALLIQLTALNTVTWASCISKKLKKMCKMYWYNSGSNVIEVTCHSLIGFKARSMRWNPYLILLKRSRAWD